LLSPEYAAVIEREPAGKVATETDAEPVLLPESHVTAPEPIATLPSKTVTVPTIVGPPDVAGVIVAVNVTLSL
jgi:hypothetical protein